MRDYLKEYAAKSTHKVDLELAGKYDYSMRREGDKPIKALMAKARRAATAASTLLKDFQDLPEKQAKEITSSATTLRNLADSMEGLAKFAKGYHAFYLNEVAKEYAATVEAFAQKRWGGDATAWALEWGVLKDLEAKDGCKELGRWLHAQGMYQGITEDEFYAPFKSGKLIGKNQRKEAAEVLLEVQGSEYQATSFNEWGKQRSCHIGTADYEMYLAGRKAAAAASAGIIKSAMSSV